MQSHDIISRTFPSDRSLVTELLNGLEDVRSSCPMSDGAFHTLALALTEAVINAIVHGNREDRSKSVRVTLGCTAEGVRCVVEDEGEGFEPEAIPDPRLPENLMREGGRGFFLMRSLTSGLSVVKTASGTRVEFLCRRD